MQSHPLHRTYFGQYQASSAGYTNRAVPTATVVWSEKELSETRSITHGEDTDLASAELRPASVYGRSSGVPVSEELIGELACRVRVWRESEENLNGSRWRPLLPSLGLLVEIGERDRERELTLGEPRWRLSV